MAEKIIAEPVRTQLDCILSSIVENADALNHLLGECVMETQTDGNDLLCKLLTAAKTISNHIGMTADLGLNKLCNGSSMKESAEAWTMPPVYHDAVKAMEVAHAQ